jgi:hypothetical protein
VSANPPVKPYCSATGYDRHAHALIRDVAWASRASTIPGLHTNDDGSVDVHIGPKRPDGHGANWLPTNADRPFEVLVRFYGPEAALFDKTWRLPTLSAFTNAGGRRRAVVVDGHVGEAAVTGPPTSGTPICRP